VVFDAQFLRRLEQLELLARKIFRGQLRGERLTRRRGRGLEFADFRPYQTGDELRYIDWNVSARLDKLFLKLFASEEELTLHVLLDTSASMGFGEPSKFLYAQRLAGAFAFLGLANLDRVGVAGIASGYGPALPPVRTRRQMVRVMEFLSGLKCGGTTQFASDLRTFSASVGSRSLVILVSDLTSMQSASAGDLERGLDGLRHAGHDVIVVQVLSEDEIAPPLDGPLELVDAETGQVLRVTVDEALREAYAKALDSHLDAIEKRCRADSIYYMRVSTLVPFEDVMLKYLRHGMAVR
jgi:uncharacterized protein (DUF58 family)